jgi:hypothetical protein
MTTAEKLRAEGEARGRAKGRAEGEARLLVRLLTLKFGPLPGTVRAHIDGASPEQLEIWADRVLSATTLDEVLS